MLTEFGRASSTLAMYDIDDLAAVSLAKHGENYFNNHVPAGRVISLKKKRKADAKQAEVKQAEEDAKQAEEEEAKEQRALYLNEAKDSYFVPTAETLDRLGLIRVRNLLLRYEGCKRNDQDTTKKDWTRIVLSMFRQGDSSQIVNVVQSQG